MRDKKGKKITGKEFFKRWKEGMANLTPIQRLENETKSTFIMLIGYLVGLVALFVYMDKFGVRLFTWGLIIIFLGAFWGNLIKWIALKGQLKIFRGLEVESLR